MAKQQPVVTEMQWRISRHAAQERVIQESVQGRFKVLMCGRRWGKTFLGQELLVYPAITDRLPVGYFAMDTRRLEEFWEGLKGVLRPAIAHLDEQQHRIELKLPHRWDVQRPVAIECWSLDGDNGPDAGRGRAYRRVVYDEAAHAPSFQRNWTKTVRFTLMDYKGDAWFLSSPNGRNYFYQLYLKGQDPCGRPDTEWSRQWISWQMSSFTNPYLSPAELESIVENDQMSEEEIQEEIYAIPQSEGGSVFKDVLLCCVGARQGVLSGHDYVFGVDWGRKKDFTVIAVFDVHQQRLVEVVRFNQIKWSIQRARLLGLADQYHPTTIVAEENSIGSPNIEALRDEGLPVRAFVTTNDSKARVVDQLALAMARQRVILLQDQQLMGELEAYEATRLPGGRLRYAAPEGLHDDMVIAVCLGYDACKAEDWSGITLQTSDDVVASLPPNLDTMTARQYLLAANRESAEDRAWRERVDAVIDVPFRDRLLTG